MSYTPSPALVDQLKRHEAFMPQPYLCPAGRATIGYGCNLEVHTACLADWPDVRRMVQAGALRGRPLVRALVERGMEWTATQAESALQKEVQAVAVELHHLCPTFSRLIAQKEAVRAEVLVNMAYNLGITGLLKFRGMLAAIEGALRGENTWASVETHMKNSSWHGQVGARARELERQMVSGVCQ